MSYDSSGGRAVVVFWQSVSVLATPGRYAVRLDPGPHVARVTGTPFAQYLTESVLAPLGMQATAFEATGAEVTEPGKF
jgi:hypothetical protein